MTNLNHGTKLNCKGENFEREPHVTQNDKIIN